MTGLKKRSTDPKVDQKKLKVNPLYNTSSLIKAVSDKLDEVFHTQKKKRK